MASAITRPAARATTRRLRFELLKRRRVMTYRTRAVLVTMAAAATAAHGQGIYRSIGPDGKVTYSDVPDAGAAKMSSGGRAAPPASTAPPAGAAAGTASGGTARADHAGSAARAGGVPGIGTAAATAAAAGGTYASGPATNEGAASPSTGRTGPKQAGVRSASGAGLQPPDDATTRAMVGALGYAVLIERTQAVCAQASPDAQGRYAQVAEAWRKRNEAALEHGRRTLETGFTSEQRRLIELDLRIKADSGLSKVTAAQPAQRIAWCERSFDEISKGALDRRGPPVSAGPSAGAALADARGR